MVQTGTKHVPSLLNFQNYLNIFVLIKNVYFISSHFNVKIIVLIYFTNLNIFKSNTKWYTFYTILYHV